MADIVDLTEDLLACRACLATNTKLRNLYGDNNLYEAFEDIVGNPIFESDDMPQHLCMWCLENVKRFVEFRKRCQVAQDLLEKVVFSGKEVTMEYIHSIDRDEHKLSVGYIQTNTLTIDTVGRLKDDLFDDPKSTKKMVRKYITEDGIKYSDDDEEENDTMFFQNIRPIMYQNAEEKCDETTSNNDDITVVNDDTTVVNDDTTVADDVFNDGFGDRADSPEWRDETEKNSEEKKETQQQKKTPKFYIRHKGPTKQTVTFCEQNEIEIVSIDKDAQMLDVEKLKAANSLIDDFYCTLCGKSCKTAEQLSVHTKTQHDPSRPIACQFCHQRFSSITSFRHHLMKHAYRFTCKKCTEFTLGPLEGVRRHAHAHGSGKPKTMQCPICKKELESQYYYYYHLRIVHGQVTDKSICRYCGITYTTKGLRFHVKKTHKVLHSSPHGCKECKVKFVTAEALERHVSGGCDALSCSRCGAGSVHENLFKLHLVQHYMRGDDISQHNCPTCNTHFLTPLALETHTLAPQCLPHPCVQCGVGHDTRDELVAHAEEHELVQLPCIQCGKIFKHIMSLYAHLDEGFCRLQPAPQTENRRWGVDNELVIKQVDSAGGARPRPERADGVMCEICGKLYAKNVLQAHKRSHLEFRFTCDYCGKKFISKLRLMYHINSHTGHRPYVCKYCDMGFAARNTLMRHEKRHTGIRPHVCHICDKTFITSTEAKSHIRAVHMNLKVARVRGPPVTTRAPVRVMKEPKRKVRKENEDTVFQQIVHNEPEIQQTYEDNLIIVPQTFDIVVEPKNVKIKKKTTKRGIVITANYDETRGVILGRNTPFDTDTRQHDTDTRQNYTNMRQHDTDMRQDDTDRYESSTIGAIERIRAIKNSFAEYETNNEDNDYSNDYSLGIPEDYGEPSTIRSCVGGKWPAGKKPVQYLNTQYEDTQDTYGHRYTGGKRGPPQYGQYTGGKRKPGSEESVSRGVRYVVARKRAKTGKHMPML